MWPNCEPLCRRHYWNQPLCRVSRALGKALNTLGKGFAECHTWQRAHDKKTIGKAVFAECLLSGTRQHSAKAEPKNSEKNRKKILKYFFN
jgi:hypothetical protein